ncbi:glycine betaine/proline transport system substrate-binding protein [Tamaricihabitans halophyticus]|uniref:Glycine betaine/proline transport system substrate-binding protein n=1 Tax=Tamaricihabitans halophyticus TaxID=1262583 RepID=A0A4R2R3D0_9PSEU|nr:glycine betaine ABC transporter substrate-binding protein [Tamaricihabitans halophyticus]TCP57322.1 glycine betaine/proline transport system substrate-binding protein [Tamaricihabitans halophyticus]
MRRNPRYRWLLALTASLAALALVVASCGSREESSSDTGQGSKTLKIAYINWAEDVALSNLFKTVLEGKGYQVELQQLEVGPLYAGLARGNADLFLDAWLPTTHADYWSQYKNDLEDLGVWYDSATLNIAVPSYVQDVNSIEDLKGKGAEFNGAITGIDPGAGLMRLTKDAVIPDYGLGSEYELKSSSEAAMIAALQGAINKKEPIVVTSWHPHWLYNRFDVKDLKDPKGSLGEAEQLHSLGRKGFSKDFPELAQMIKKFKMDDEKLSSLTDAINKAGEGNELQATKQWAKDNQDWVDQFSSAVTG